MNEEFPLIVVGASQGGIDALSRIVSQLPADFPAAIAIVIHTHESSPRHLAKMLGSHTPLPVDYALDGGEIVVGHVVIAPPGTHLVVRPDRRFGLEHSDKVRFTRPAADRLFESAARVLGRRVIGVVLTGGDSDGTDGLQAVKRHGGVSVVQSPADSRAPSMPLSAIFHDSPDHIVILDEMGPLLVGLVGDR